MAHSIRIDLFTRSAEQLNISSLLIGLVHFTGCTSLLLFACMGVSSSRSIFLRLAAILWLHQHQQHPLTAVHPRLSYVNIGLEGRLTERRHLHIRKQVSTSSTHFLFDRHRSHNTKSCVFGLLTPTPSSSSFANACALVNLHGAQCVCVCFGCCFLLCIFFCIFSLMLSTFVSHSLYLMLSSLFFFRSQASEVSTTVFTPTKTKHTTLSCLLCLAPEDIVED